MLVFSALDVGETPEGIVIDDDQVVEVDDQDRAFGKAFRIRRFMSKFLGVSLLNFASKKGRTWEHGPGTPSKLLSSRSFSERLERSEKAFRKRRFISKFLGVFRFCFGGKKERIWEHKARTT